MMHPRWLKLHPFNAWLHTVIDLIRFKAAHEHSYEEIIQTVREYSPESGWDEDTKRFVKLAAKIAKRDADEF